MFILGVLICCMAASQINFTKFMYLSEDSLLSAIFVISRYLFQLIRLVCLVRSSRKILQIHKVADEIDLGEFLPENDTVI